MIMPAKITLREIPIYNFCMAAGRPVKFRHSKFGEVFEEVSRLSCHQQRILSVVEDLLAAQRFIYQLSKGAPL